MPNRDDIKVQVELSYPQVFFIGAALSHALGFSKSSGGVPIWDKGIESQIWEKMNDVLSSIIVPAIHKCQETERADTTDA